MIWVFCNGKDPVDQENIGGFKYAPFPGFPSYFYPYLNQPGYMPPIVSVQIINPRSELKPLEIHT